MVVGKGSLREEKSPQDPILTGRIQAPVLPLEVVLKELLCNDYTQQVCAIAQRHTVGTTSTLRDDFDLLGIKSLFGTPARSYSLA